MSNADVDGAGRADVGHGAGVGDLVDGAHQLEVGDGGHVQLKDRKIRGIENMRSPWFGIHDESVN